MAIIGAYVAWPYYSLQQLRLSLDAGDTEAVDRLVDWPAVRAGLEADLGQTSAAPTAADSETSKDIASRLAGMLAPAMTDMMIDAYASPVGLSRLLRGATIAVEAEEMPLTTGQASAHEALEAVKGQGSAGAIEMTDDGSQIPPILANAVSSAKGKFNQAKDFAVDTYDTMSQQYDYVFFTGPRTFKAEFAPASQQQSESLAMVMRFQDMRWQLVRVRLPR
jgi:hypothetical protein